jgi:hypothetical protein
MDPLDKYLKQPVKPQPQGFNPASLLPAVLGTAGTIGGAIIGGPVGAGVGGALGGGAGSALEQALSGRALDPGTVAKEAAISGVLGYGPLRAVGAVTGIRAGRTAAEAVARRTGTQAAQALAPTAAGVPRLTSAAGRAATMQTGIGAETRYLGQNLGTNRATRVLSVVYNKAGVSSIDDSVNALPKVEQFAKQVGKNISDTIKPVKIPAQTFTAEKNTLLSDLTNKFSAVKSVNYKNSEFAKNTLKAVRSAKTPDDLWQIKKQISNEAISWTRNPQSMVPGSEMFARSATQSLNSSINKLVPSVKPLNADFSDAMVAQDILGAIARSPRGINAPLPLMNRISGRPLQRAAGVLAGTGRQAAPATGQVAQPLVPSAAQGMTRLEQALRFGGQGRAPLVEGGIGANIATLRGLAPGQIAGAVRTAAPSAAKRQLVGAVIGGKFNLESANPSIADEQAFVETTQPVAAPQAVNPYPIENMLYDVSRDPKNANKYIAIFNTVQSNIKNQTKTQNLTEAQQARQDIIGLLNDVTNQINSGGVIIGPKGILGKIEMAKAGFGIGDQNTVDFYTNLGNLLATIARTRGGTSFTANEQKMLERYAPNINDSEQEIRSKLNNLAKQFPAGGTGTTVFSPADIQNQALMGLGE